ncbi:hypothetical protein KSS93_03880 [Pseudomonas xanthosomatis]|uniref:hypothetical protein n=1 Tax=Pseudomonas xanthosomatis TaxID=2842356 RepID=UPI001C3E2FAA|nr:hypothetical protein [Pseudomonas xanthosomatis]QXH47072.1 hypothetical protein KSS93_03880 [Pseudomonas xanthosomatis]
MKGKAWREHLAAGRIEAAGRSWCLQHLQAHTHGLLLPGVPVAIEATLHFEYSSHCVSHGPPHGQALDFQAIGLDRLVIDSRGISRAFCPVRYGLSLQLPSIMSTLADRQCLFTGHSNWLTVEGNQFGFPEGTQYEVYFNMRRESTKVLKVHVESAYVRDPEHPSAGKGRFKRHEKIKGWLLMLKKLRNEPVRRPARR